MKSGTPRGKSNTPAEAWRELISKELKINSKLGKTFEKAGFGGCSNKILTLYFVDEDSCKAAKGQVEPLKKKLPSDLQPCDRVNCIKGTVPAISQIATTQSTQSYRGKLLPVSNPLQALNHAQFGDDGKGNELSLPVLEAAVQAERNCNNLYDKLRKRTEELAGGEENTVLASFNWRLRVGGTRGFRELLLPVFHPIFGIPYIPSASLKGAARAWARQYDNCDEIENLLGVLEGKKAKAAKVEFLDAFPTSHCLDVDVATPQWHWQGSQVVYQPEPHPLLSMEQPQLLIGLRPASRRGHQQTQEEWETSAKANIQTVKTWLENALRAGIGSRVSSGYGHALGQVATLPYSQSYDFDLWTQGMYGSNPPTKQNFWQGKPEFRPTAIRGILRYWFRAVALSLYEAEACQTLEDTVFGKLSQQGKVGINVLFNQSNSQQSPYRYTGKTYLEATEQKYLDLIRQLLLLASHLGGIGRGSRRPLHLLDINGRLQMRGCHWSIEGTIEGDDFPLPFDAEQWKTKLFKKVTNAFNEVLLSTASYTSSPGTPGKNKDKKSNRHQDALDNQAQVWLVKSLNQIAPDKVNDWELEDTRDEVRGTALNLFYSNKKFKGEKRFTDEHGVEQREGNPYVGGALETPSFVWIKSIFPVNGTPYQVITIFGANHPDRLALANELDTLKKQQQAMLVFGTMPPPKGKPQRPQRQST